MTPSPGRPSGTRRLLFLYAVLLLCPIRYWSLGRDVDSTWRFALNYAAAHGLVAGRDVLFTYGPLGYLLFPEHLGNNLAQGLIFQAVLWMALAAILFDLFFRAGLRVRNLALFCVCIGLSAPLFWFNFGGGENLLLAGALLLIVLFQLRGSAVRYGAALVLIGLLPLFKLTAGMVGFAALAGVVVFQVMERGRKALPFATVTVMAPVAVAVTVCLASLRSVPAFVSYLRGSAQLTSGYSAAMSFAGSGLESVAAAAAVGVVLLLLRMQTTAGMARFYALLLAIPLFVSFKHGFVRQDAHVINYFCFIALAAALMALTARLEKRMLPYLGLILLVPLTLWLNEVQPIWLIAPAAEITGLRSLHTIVGAVPFSWLRERLEGADRAYPAEQKLEPELIAAIGNAPVGSLSIVYTNLAAAHLRVALYPVLQRYSAYTAVLDALNAAWVRERGPRFLVFDGQAIDQRDAWAETPAMWLEVYRWYDTRLLGKYNLLLERRAMPRFTSLERMRTVRMAWPGELRMAEARAAVFWSLKCGLTPSGRIRQAVFRIPEVRMTIQPKVGSAREARVIMAVLPAPVLAAMPGTLAEFAAVFRGELGSGVAWLRFGGSGAAYYGDSCEVEFQYAK